MTDYKHLFRQTIWIYVFTFLIIPVSFFLRILYANKLTVVDYGLFYSLLAFFALFGTFRDFGLTAASSYFSQKYLIQNDTSKVKTIFFIKQAIELFFSILIAILLFVFREAIITKFYHDEGHVRFMFTLFTIWWVIKTIKDSNIIFFTIFQEQKMAKLLEFLDQFLILLLSFFGFFFIAAYMVPIYSYLIVTIIILLLSFFFLIKSQRYLLVDPFYKKPDLFKEVLLYAMAFLPASFSVFLLSQNDTLVIQYFNGAEQVAYYSSGFSVATILFLFIAPLSMILPPLLARLWHGKKHEELSTVINALFNNLLLFLLPLTFFFFVFAEQLVGLLFGTQFLPAVPILQLFSITFILNIIYSTLFTVLGSFGQPKKASIILIIGALLNLVLDVILIQFYGIMGVAVATSICYLIMMVLGFMATAKYIKFRIDLVNNLKVLLASSLFIAACFLLKDIIHLFQSGFVKLDFILNAGLVFGMALVVYIGALFALRVITREKIALMQSLFKGYPKVR